jgi:cation:H+ antiporter
MNEYLWVAAGFALLILGAEALVHGAVAVARRLHVSPLLIGVTIVAYGTSTPELLVSTEASLRGAYGIAVGNVVGSNIFNILFILGVTALIAPITVSPRAIGRDAVFALVAVGLFFWVALSQPVINFHEGVLFLAVLVAMVLISYSQEYGRGEPAVPASRFEKPRPLEHPTAIDLGLILAGLGLLVVGAHILVENAVLIARNNGISETVIGLTLVAAGTSLPELATSVVAAARRNSDIALGNVTGSNIYNILAILGLAALLGPVQIDPQIVQIDMWVMLGATVGLLLPLAFGNRMGRTYGLLLLAAYLGYVAYLFDKAGVIDLPFAA